MKNTMLLEAETTTIETLAMSSGNATSEKDPLQTEFHDILTQSGIEDETVTLLISGGIKNWDQFLDEQISVGKLVSMGISSKQRERLIEISCSGPTNMQKRTIAHAERRPSREKNIGMKDVIRQRPDRKKKTPWRVVGKEHARASYS